MRKRPSSQEGLFSSCVITMVQSITLLFSDLLKLLLRFFIITGRRQIQTRKRGKCLEIRVNVVGFKGFGWNDIWMFTSSWLINQRQDYSMYRTIWESKSVEMWPILLDRDWYIHKIYLKNHPFLLILPTTDFIPNKHILTLSQHAIFFPFHPKHSASGQLWLPIPCPWDSMTAKH